MSNAPTAAIRLRPYPYPFRCALTICSDIDRCSFDDFIAIHRFLNTDLDTEYGPGLQLEIGDSFWMYSAGSKTDDAFSYFDKTSTTPSAHAEQIREAIHAGYLDCLHSWGHFSQYGGFHRRMAEAALKELEQHKLKVKVWINHGDHHNFQNIGSPGLGDALYQVQASGDTTPVEEYHADLTLGYGIEFAWIGNNTPIVGQDRRYRVREALYDKLTREGAVAMLRAMSKSALRRLRIQPSALPTYQDNALLQPMQLRDGQPLYIFKRFLPDMFWGRDFGDDLIWSLQPTTLDKLEDRQGMMFIYAHMGKKRQPQRIFTENTVKALQELRRRRDSGAIWIGTTSRLLQYSRMRRYLRWQAATAADGAWEINIDGVNDSTKNQNTPLTPAELPLLQGLTWYTPEPKKTRIVVAGKRVDCTINPPDTTGVGSVSVPLKPLNPKNWTALYKK